MAGMNQSTKRIFGASNGALIGILVPIVGLILAVIGLGGVRTYWIAGLTSLVVGIAHLLESDALGSRVSGIVRQEESEWYLGEGVMTGRLPAGIIGIILGILSILAVVPRILLPISAIVFGAALILGTAYSVSLNDAYLNQACEREDMREITRAGVRFFQTFEGLLGCATVVLGIIGLAEMAVVPVTLSLVAFLLVGFSSFLNRTFFSTPVLQSLHCVKVTSI